MGEAIDVISNVTQAAALLDPTRRRSGLNTCVRDAIETADPIAFLKP
jgi:hypothetical protein